MFWTTVLVARVAKEMGVSPAGAHRWLKRYVENGWGRDCRQVFTPTVMPARHPGARIDEVLAAREKHRQGPVALSERWKVPPRTVAR